MLVKSPPAHYRLTMPLVTPTQLVSVVIPTWNRRDELLACLDSLRTQAGIAFETIVIDDGSDDGTPQAVTERFPDVRLIGDPRRLGPEARRNQGIMAARGECVLFLDSDVVFQDPGLMQRVHQRLMEDPTIGELGGEYPRHDREHANGHRYTRSWYPERVRIHRDATAELDVDFLPACFIMCRRDMLLRSGGFDPYYRFGPTDADLGLRIAAMGYRNVVGARYAIWHNASEGGRRPDQVWCYCSGRIRMLIKLRGLPRTALQMGWDLMRLTPLALRWLLGGKLNAVERNGLKLIPKAYAWHIRHLRHTLSCRKRNFLKESEIEAFEAWASR